jgi:hypothetical protein
MSSLFRYITERDEQLDQFLRMSQSELRRLVGKEGIYKFSQMYSKIIVETGAKRNRISICGGNIIHVLVAKGPEYFYHIGVIINANPQLATMLNDNGETPLMFAIRCRKRDCALFLLELLLDLDSEYSLLGRIDIVDHIENIQY